MTTAAATGAAPDDLVLHTTDANGIATLTLNRPGKFNALSMAMMVALEDALRAVAADTNVRVIVLAGGGKAFCAGHDLKELRDCSGRQATEALFAQCSQLMLTMTGIAKPIIARVHGVATAAGCQLVATADLAVAVETARFAVSGVNLGLFCSTPMVALTRNLPRKQAMEMLMTGNFIDARTALQYGLVNRVVPADQLDAAVGELAASIAAKSPAAIAFGKRLFYAQLEAAAARAYELAAATMTDNLMTEDAALGMDAFLAKQPMPAWKGR